ncbi:DEAD-box type RNA helicase [Ascosphaera aggregata]|nr:DEAD-box type RNA helicase [Ascosphaera aggregata]
MLEFCRDVIQFAALLFDQFSVFVSAIEEFDAQESKPAKTALLQPLTATMRWMVKWLRLKDEYLAHTLVELVLKVLHYLAELKVTISQDALSFIEGTALTSVVRTILTDHEKAELIRALEFYYGKALVPVPEKQVVKTKQPMVATKSSVMKQSRIDAFAQRADAASVSSSTSAKLKKEEDEYDDIPDEVLLEMAGATEMQNRLTTRKIASPALRTPSLALTTRTGGPAVAPKSLQSIQSFREKREKEREEKKKRDALELARLKSKIAASKAGFNEDLAHQGSGLLSLKVPVADHTPHQESMMVSSESEFSEEDEDDETDLLGGRKSVSKPDAVRAYEESRKLLKTHVPVRKTKVLRSAKDMRARLMPDLTSLHRTILNWDPFAHKGSDFPPNAGRTDFSFVSNVFPTAADYQRTFEPLLMLEAWQSFQSVIEESSSKPYPVNILTRLNVDSFVEVVSNMTPQDYKSIGISEADLVVLSTNSVPTDAQAPKCLARIGRCKKEKGKMEIAYRVNNSSNMITYLNPQQKIFATKITSLTPMEREYCALMALQHYDLSDEIIRAKPSPILNYQPESIQPLQRIYNLNGAQAKAVKSALDNDAFTLIQGPPGSGKTKTICALVGALLSPTLGQAGGAVRISGADFKPATRTTAAKKLLICAPSNAAVDELVMRLKAGGKTLNGRDHPLNVVRLGRSDAINANVLDVTLDELIAQKMGGQNRKTTDDPFALVEEHKATNARFTEVRQQIEQIRSQGQSTPPELQREFDILKQSRAQLSMSIDSARENKEKALRDEQVDRRRVQQEIINNAHVICATLSGSGHEMFQTLSIEFETVIIDEAAQSIELSALIPLKYGCSKCILVGDPKQLPPTVLSREAARFQYEQSLFVRMQANHPKDVHLLDTQYRMHPDISSFPSSAFYDGRLKNGPDMGALRKRLWHNSSLLSPYRFFDVRGMHANITKGHSLVNHAEIRVAMKLYERLITDYGSKYEFDQKIGIITPYKGQLRELKNQFSAKHGKTIFEKVEFNTTDAFQGRECEVIIFSCVRASNRGIGFLADIRRMNVGLTRAKSSLWVLGNSQSLVQGEFWRALIEDAQNRKLYTTGDVLQILNTTQLSLEDQYDDVEMTDVGVATASNPPVPVIPNGSDIQRPVSATPSVDMGSGRSSPSTSLGRRTESVKSTPSGSPRLAPRIGRPSGGGNGLNDLQTCGYCGSYEHMTHACGNEDAKTVSQGTCSRCKNQGHSIRDCTISRCLRCGEFGHITGVCKSKKELSRRDKDRIRWEETKHERAQKARMERRKQRQMGEHDRKVPSILVTDDQQKPAQAGGLQKRRREETGTPSAQAGRDTKKSRPMPLPPSIPRGRKFEREAFAPPPSDLIDSSKKRQPKLSEPGALTGGEFSPPNVGDFNCIERSEQVADELLQQINQNENRDRNLPSGPNQGQQPRPPAIRRKKPVDPFIRPKRR